MGQGKWRKGKGKKVGWWAELAETAQHSQLYPAEVGQLRENTEATQPPPTHALWGGMEKLGKCNKETEVPTAEIQAKCRNRSVFNINPFTTQTN